MGEEQEGKKTLVAAKGREGDVARERVGKKNYKLNSTRKSRKNTL